MIILRKLRSLMSERGITKKEIIKNTKITANEASKIASDGYFKGETVDILCNFLSVQPGDIMEYVTAEEYENALKEREFDRKNYK